MARLADAQADGAMRRVGCDAGVQLSQPLKRVGLQQPERGIHGRIIEDP
jgi:hypothetical protein